MSRFTQTDVEEKTADFIIEVIDILEDYYPDTWGEIIQAILDGTYE